jgi:predicted HTH transcriptional regulator
MTVDEFDQILTLGHETSDVEFKPPGLRAGALQARVIRAMLGMANRRDGGYVVLGVEENPDHSPRPVGLSPEQMESWKHDDTSTAVQGFADPFVTFKTEHHTKDGAHFLVFVVSEFELVPVLCKKGFPHPTEPNKMILRGEGTCYVRTRRKPETAQVASQTEMRDLLDLAIDKGVRRFVERAKAAGAWPSVQATPGPTDQDRFNEQIKDLR